MLHLQRKASAAARHQICWVSSHVSSFFHAPSFRLLVKKSLTLEFAFFGTEMSRFILTCSCRRVKVTVPVTVVSGFVPLKVAVTPGVFSPPLPQLLLFDLFRTAATVVTA